MSEYKLKIGITQGDPNGIGWEVILKALSDPRMTELFTPVVYGSPAAAAYYRNTLGDTEPVAFNTVPATPAAARPTWSYAGRPGSRNRARLRPRPDALRSKRCARRRRI